MTTSPLERRRAEFPAADPVQVLHDHVAKVNNYNWVVASGKLFFVAQKQRANGVTEHFVDRSI